jgi:hypothetical protein
MSKFNVGDRVFYRPLSAHSRNAARGAYEVLRVLPSETQGRFSYLIKSTQEDYERVAEEGELVAI